MYPTTIPMKKLGYMYCENCGKSTKLTTRNMQAYLYTKDALEQNQL